MEKNRISLLFTGDLIPISLDSNRNHPLEIGSQLSEIFANNDLRIVNLECPITDTDNKIQKTGPHLKASVKDLELLNTLNVDIACLSNNHIRDFGEQGVLDTITNCQKNNIQTLGAGRNLEEAAIPKTVTINGKRITFLNFSENEYNFASKDRAGSNPDDVIHIWESIQKAKTISDILIVIMHGGKEMYPYPTPHQLDLFRFIAKQGVDAVIGHHTHVIGKYEILDGVPIVYSLGNFIFDEPNNPPEWYKGAIVSLSIDIEQKDISLQFFEVSQKETIFEITDSTTDISTNASSFIQKVNTSEVKEKWNHLIQKQHLGTIKAISNLSLIDRVLLKLKIKKLDNKAHLLALGNRLRCQTHRIFTLDAIEYFIKK